MLKKLKKISLGMSMAVAIATAPLTLQAGAVEGLSESTSAGLEAPNFEHQLVRINTGINFTRLSYDIMNNMPISEDSEWVDKAVMDMSMDIVKSTIELDEVKNDAYFSTAAITNVILRRPVLHMSPAILRLYYVSSVMYKNKSNGHPDFHMPDFNEFPDVTNLETYAKFKENPEVALIDVEAKTGNVYPNVQSAIIGLLPDDLQERAVLALEEKDVILEDFKKSRANVALLESWIDDEKNTNDPDIENKKKGLLLSQEKNTILQEEYNKKKDIYLAILDQGALHISANYDESKVPLAKKIAKLLELVDDGAINAVSLFTAASIGIYKGYGEVDKEMKAILAAQALTSLVGNQKQFLIERYQRMVIGAVMAVPHISVGTYYVMAGRGTISTYKDVVAAVIDGAEAQEAALREAEETARVIEAQEAAEAPATETN